MVNKFEIALNFAKRLGVQSSLDYIHRLGTYDVE